MESHGRLVACGSQDGSITLIEVSNNLRLPGKSEKLLMSGVGSIVKMIIFIDEDENIYLYFRCLIERHDEQE